MSKKTRVITLSGNENANLVLTTKLKKNGIFLLRIFESDPSFKVGDRPNPEIYNSRKNKEALVVLAFPNRRTLEGFLRFLNETRDIMIKREGMAVGFNQGTDSTLSALSDLSNINTAEIKETIEAMKLYMEMLEKAEKSINSIEELLSGVESSSATDEQKEKIKDLIRGKDKAVEEKEPQLVV